MKPSGKLPSGFTCYCGHGFNFSPYVYACWDIQLRVKCSCGREYQIQRGRASQIVQAEGLVKK